MTEKLNTALLRIGWAIWTLFAVVLAVNVGLLPSWLLPKLMMFRWQPWLLMGILAFVSRDLLASWHCRSCKTRDHLVIRGLFTMGGLLCQSCFEAQLRCTTADLGLPAAAIESRLPSSPSESEESGPDWGLYRRDRQSEREPKRTVMIKTADNAIGKSAKESQLKLLLQAQMKKAPPSDDAPSAAKWPYILNNSGDFAEPGQPETAFRPSRGKGKELSLIESTLQRIDEGSYGICSRCAQPIPPQHLKTVPWAEHCLECQNAAAA
jgi:RNA polymerase-binding transcription factor DksA